MATTRKSAPGTVTLNHAMIYSADLEASLRFYTEALGLKPLELMMPFYARLQSPKGTTTIALHKLEPGGAAASPGVRLYFETPKLAAAVKRVEKAGYVVKVPVKKMPWGWSHAYVNDPDGYEISLYWSGGKRLKKAK
jgi:catechol 2,3-dioxygenase-like lactoylglutathione lyase family enzyme